MSNNGKGILHQIMHEEVFPITDLTFKGGLWEQIDQSNKREFTMMSSSRGMQLFEDSFKRMSLTALLEDMTNDFTPEEMIRMKEMIDSEDVENMKVAEVIIDVKLRGKIE